MRTHQFVVATLIAAFSIQVMASTCSPDDKKDAIRFVTTVAEPSLKKSIKENPEAKADLPALQKVIAYVKARKSTISCKDAMAQKAKASFITTKYSDAGGD